jgi:hypothetical protein
MVLGLPRGNPYDFRSPVRHRGLLAGRAAELAEIDKLMRESAGGRPVHISLFGPQGMGKSSLLNGVVDLARHRGFLAVKLPLREAVVQSELSFYRALIDAALRALTEDGTLPRDNATMTTWVRQTCTGDASSEGAADQLELGLLVAAKSMGRAVDAVPPQLVERDVKRLLALSATEGTGLVLCLDNANLLDDNIDLAPSLMELTDLAPRITIVTAAEAAGSLQKAAPRAWAQIEVEPFTGPDGVLDAITKPIDTANATLGNQQLALSTVLDIQELTEGAPYEINLVCHFIWDAIQQGGQDSFELSTSVIERVAQELGEQERHQAGGEIAIANALTAGDYRILSSLAPYEALTVRQLGLLRLMFNDYEPAELEASVASIRAELEHLQTKSIVRIEQDRFAVVGGRDARLYLKYAARTHTGKKLVYGDSYAHAATAGCAVQLGRALMGDEYDASRILALGRPRELGSSDPGSWLEIVADAVARGDIVTLSQAFWPRIPRERAVEHGENSSILLGLQLQAGLHDVEHTEVIARSAARPIDELRAAVEQWLDEHAQLLEKFDVRVVKWHCEEIPSHILRASLAYGELRYVCQASYLVYRDGATEAAESLIGAGIDGSAQLVGSDPTDPLLRMQVANALHRRGFMAATRGDWDTALERLDGSRTMALTDEWLLDYNTAFVKASQGDLAGAVKLGASAVDRYVEAADHMVLHAYFPAPGDWAPQNERWRVIEVHGGWIKRFVELQLAVLIAAESPAGRAELEAALEALSDAAPSALLRLAGWAQLGLLDNATAAAALFERAVGASPYDETQIPYEELSYAKTRAS